MDGSYKNEKFFRCPQGYGLMISSKKVEKVGDVKDDFKNADVFKEWADKMKKEAESEAAVAKAKATSAAMMNLFKALDADGGGDLSKEEFVKALKSKGVDEAESGKLFAAIDATNNSGSVSMAEFKNFLKNAEGDCSMIPPKIQELLTAELS